MARVRVARPMHVVGWGIALVALAWFTGTQTAGDIDRDFAGWVSGLPALRVMAVMFDGMSVRVSMPVPGTANGGAV